MTQPRQHPYGRPLPWALAQIADAAGIDAAMKIAEARGGNRLEIARDSAVLREIVGAEAATAIAEKLGVGTRIYVPLGDYHLVQWLKAQGVPRAEIGRRARVSLRTMQRWDAPPEAHEQLSLKLAGE